MQFVRLSMTGFKKLFSTVQVIIFINMMYIICRLSIHAQSKIQFCHYMSSKNLYGHVKFVPGPSKISLAPCMARVSLICHPHEVWTNKIYSARFFITHTFILKISGDGGAQNRPYVNTYERVALCKVRRDSAESLLEASWIVAYVNKRAALRFLDYSRIHHVWRPLVVVLEYSTVQ